jgi:hypothetical protein
MSEEFLIIAQFTNYVQADLARQQLEGEGINVVMTGQNADSAYTGLPGVSDIRLLVPASQVIQARETLDAWREQMKEAEGEDSERQEDGSDDSDESSEERE